MHGAVHLVLFVAYLFLALVPWLHVEQITMPTGALQRKASSPD